MIVKCTCGGLENCTRCFGSGEFTRFQDKVSPSIADASRNSAINSSSFSLSKGKLSEAEAAVSGAHAVGRPRPRKPLPLILETPILFEKFLSCPRCPEEQPRIATRNIRKHLSTKHGIRGKQKMNELLHLAKRETAVGRAASYQGFAEFLGSAEDLSPGADPRDGSKNFGFPAREGSQYGSHSSHDSFDDESSAD